jgi:hypothetical protein
MRSSSYCLSSLATAAVVALAACTTDPARQQDQVKAMEPQARAAAQERATTDTGCGAVSSQIMSNEHGNLGDAYSLRRVVYRVQVTGCGMRSNYAVACVIGSMCSAMSDGDVERVK